MGFFSDLKEDLSQAVSELMPDETADAGLAEDEPVIDETPELQTDSQVLADMLDKLEAMSETGAEEADLTEAESAAGTEEVQTEEDRLLAELFSQSEGFAEGAAVNDLMPDAMTEEAAAGENADAEAVFTEGAAEEKEVEIPEAAFTEEAAAEENAEIESVFTEEAAAEENAEIESVFAEEAAA
ncbi:MAG: hypothetical protein NC254_14120, partial [bacterium]|nr:hypothetical protein [bacterium]